MMSQVRALFGEPKRKAIQSDGFFFLLFGIKIACDIMILISSAYRLSVAKLVVYEKKEPKRLFFLVKGTKQGVSEARNERVKRLCACRVALDMFAQIPGV